MRVELVSALLAVQAFSCMIGAYGRNEWENWPLQEYQEVLPPYPTTPFFPNLYDGVPTSPAVYPGLAQTSFFVPPKPPPRAFAFCRVELAVGRLIDTSRFGYPDVRSTVVQINPRSHQMEIRLFLRGLSNITSEARMIVESTGSLMGLRPVPPMCLYVKGDNNTYFTESVSSGRVRAVTVHLTPEAFGVYQPSKSPIPLFSFPPDAPVNETFVHAGPCLLATRVNVGREELLIQAAPTEVRVRAILGGGAFKTLRMFRWHNCQCAPKVLREIAVWTKPEGHETLVLVQTGRTPGQTDQQKCQEQILPRRSAVPDHHGRAPPFRDSPLFGP